MATKEPIELVIAKGKKHLTKEEIENRKAMQINIPTKEVTTPDYLPKNLIPEYEKYSDILLNIGIMTELDTECLARYLISKQQYLAFTNELTGAMRTRDIDKQMKLQTMQDKSFKQCQQCARDLGLTISSRCKLVVPKGYETAPPKKNKFEKFTNIKS